MKLHEFGAKFARKIPYAVLESRLFDGWRTICFTEIVKIRKYRANFYSVWIVAQFLSFPLVDNLTLNDPQEESV